MFPFGFFDTVIFIWIAFLGIAVPVFTFGVYRMAHIIDKSKEKIEWEQSEMERKVNHEIKDLTAALEEAKTKALEKEVKKIERKIEKLKQKKAALQREVVSLLKSYETLSFKNSVVIPGIYFFSAIAFGLGTTIYSIYRTVQITFFLSVFFALLGIYRVLKCLKIMLDIKQNAEKYLHQKMKDSFTESLIDDDEKNM